MIEHALDLTRRGFWIFPIVPNAKSPPAMAGWQDLATRDESTIRRLWQKNHAFNIGISTSRYGDDNALLVVDIDSRPGKDGYATLFSLEMEGCDFPPTFEVATPSGGKHIFFSVTQALRQGANTLGAGIDTRSRGGYVVGAGSAVDGARYTISADRPVAPVPEWLAGRLGAGDARRDRHVAAGNVPAVTAPSAIARGAEYLRSLDVVTAGGRNDTGFRVACRLKDLGADEGQCRDLMAEHWRCEPPLDPAELEHVVGSAYRYGGSPQGVDAPEAQFTPIVKETPKSFTNETHPYEKLNKEFAFVIAGGGSHILWETVDSRGRPYVEHLTITAFHQKHSAWKWTVGKKEEAVTVSWMESKQRRSYDGICFDPSAGPEVEV